MKFDNVNVRMDINHNMWVDIKVTEIQQLHRAAMLGGKLCIYKVYDSYFMNLLHVSEKVFINFYGLELTEQQYEFQVNSWGDNYYMIQPGTSLILADNLYFI